MKTLVLTLPLALLAACDSGPDVDMTNASVAEVANQVRESDSGLTAGDGFIRAGLWSTKVTLAEVDIPGMPPEFKQRMAETMSRTGETRTCLSAADVKKPKEDFFAGDARNCRYDHFRMGGGKIDARMRCQAEGMSQLMEMSGSYSPDSYKMSMTTRAEGPQTEQVGAMTMKMNVESTRVGDCTPEQADKA